MTVRDLTASPLAISLFGPFAVLVNGVPLPRLRWRRKQEAILALLALRHGRVVDRAWLAGVLWPDVSESEGLATLRRYLTDLRRALGPEADRLRSPTSATLLFDLAGAAVDVISFDAALSRGGREGWEAAASLYRGPLLEGWMDEWVFEERQAREQGFLQALEKLALSAGEHRDLGTAERHLRRAIAVDPLRESAQRALMQTLAAGGSYAAAAQVYQELRRRLHQELNAEPDPETQALFQQLRAEARGKAGASRQTPDATGDARSARFAGTRTPGVNQVKDFPMPLDLPELASGAWRPASGTVTFLLTDIEGSTRLWLDDSAAMRLALARHDALAAAVIDQHDGFLVKQRGEGDSLFAVFARATDAVATALEFQRALGADDHHPHRGYPTCGGDGLTDSVPDGPALDGSGHQVIRSSGHQPPLRVRIALHTGEAEVRGGDYYGLAVNHCARLRAVGHGGQVLLSQTTVALVRDDLPADASLRELGTHRLKDLQRAEPLFQLLHPELPAEFPPLRSLEAFAHNLPVQLTSFIGREGEMAEVERLLPTTHLLTLTGAGGCGKTRLALQVASDLVGDSEAPGADGVWLVELASLSDPGLVLQTVASTLGVREEPGRPLADALIDSLRPRSLLLLLDNCEHLLSACAPLVDRLLRACPHLRILATSREALGLLGEQTYRVPSLSLPPTVDRGRLRVESPTRASCPDLATLHQSEAVQLFLHRALFNQPAFAVTEGNAPAVAEICRRLDGIPLAIELAAARVRAIPVEKLNERLDDMFRLLAGGNRGAMPRQQTLRALIDWSYDLLAEPERRLLRCLSVFGGGWTLEAAEAVCAVEGIEDWEILDLLTSLVEKSLVQYEDQAGVTRYRLLETIRQYAWERLREAGETEAVRGQHLGFFLRLAEEADSRMLSPERTVWLDWVDREHDNLRSALDWCQADGERVEAGLRLAGALSAFWALRGYGQEGQRWVQEALARAGSIGRTASRARALLGAGRLAGAVQGGHAAARCLLEESAAIWRELGQKQGLAQSLALLGWAVLHQGDEARARSVFEEALELAQAIGCQWCVLTSLNGLAWTAHQQGDWELARSLREQLLALSREKGDRWGTALALTGLGSMALEQGDWEAARALYEECLPVRRELGQKAPVAGTLRTLGVIALAQGNWQVARSRCEESLPVTRELADPAGLLECLETLAGIAAGQGQSDRAARLFGAAEALRERLGESRSASLATTSGGGAAPSRAGFWFEAAQVLAIVGKRSVAAIRSALGEKAFAVAWAAGREMSIEQALADALEHRSVVSG